MNVPAGTIVHPSKCGECAFFTRYTQKHCRMGYTTKASSSPCKQGIAYLKLFPREDHA